MAISYFFGGKTIKEPGSYSRIVGGSTPIPAASAFGKVLLISTGIDDGFGIGSGINGDLASGKNAVYEFSDLTDFRNVARGGLFWDLAEYLFKPSVNGKGVDSIKIVQAATTEKATITFTFANGTTVFDTINEGRGANGISMTVGADTLLVKGFAARMESGVVDPTKFRFVFEVGGFNGANNCSPDFTVASYASGTTYAAGAFVYYNGLVWISLQGSNTGKTPGLSTSSGYWGISEYGDNYGDKLPSESVSKILVVSPEYTTIAELVAWMQTDSVFKLNFKYSSHTITTTGAFVAGDLTTMGLYQLAVGGTTTYNATDIDDVLDNITEEDNSFIMTDLYDADAQDTINSDVLTYINNDADFAKILVLGGGYDSTEFSATDGSIDIAEYFNSPKVVVVHGGCYVAKFGGGEKALSSIYTAALALGRTAGLEPQVPATWKDIRINRPVHELSKKQRETALATGVLHIRYVDGKGWVINQAINSMQRNDILFTPDGDSYEVSIERIKMQLNKELIINSRVLFVGGNYNTASAEDVKLFTEGYLQSRTARPGQDNLIKSSRDVKVVLSGDAWSISYGFVPNGPINKLFFTGVMLDANISI
jgi:hypothetical protein